MASASGDTPVVSRSRETVSLLPLAHSARSLGRSRVATVCSIQGATPRHATGTPDRAAAWCCTVWAALCPLWCGVFGFECFTHQYAVGYGVVEERGEVGDDAPVSQVRIGGVVLKKGLGNIRCEDIPLSLNVFSVVVLGVGQGWECFP